MTDKHMWMADAGTLSRRFLTVRFERLDAHTDQSSKIR